MWPSPTICTTVAPATPIADLVLLALPVGRQHQRPRARRGDPHPHDARLQHVDAVLRVGRLLGQLLDLLRVGAPRLLGMVLRTIEHELRGLLVELRLLGIGGGHEIGRRDGLERGLAQRGLGLGDLELVVAPRERRVVVLLLELLLRGVGLVLHGLERAHQLRGVERDDGIALLDVVAVGREARDLVVVHFGSGGGFTSVESIAVELAGDLDADHRDRRA